MIEDWRDEIDGVDERILSLLNERATLSSRIIRLKSARSLPYYSPRREEEILRSLTRGNPGPLGSDSVEKIFRTIIEESKALAAGRQKHGREKP